MEKKIIILVFLFISYSGFTQNLFVKVESETANVWNGKKVTITQDLFFQRQSNKLVTHFIKPEDYFYLTNLNGEAKFYYPSSNSVKLMHDLFLSSQNNILYYFVNNTIGDMGLKEAGFIILSSKQEGNMDISEWKPPLDLVRQIGKVELVHENYLPKFMAYYNPKGNFIKKVYYSDYEQYGSFVLPKRIVEIEYKSETDSVIHSQVFKNVRTAYSSFDEYFDFKIPENAKLEKN